MIRDFEAMTAIASLVAVAISIVAVVLSHRGESAEQLRQKREELRHLLARIIEIRLGFTDLKKETDSNLRAQKSSVQNSARAMYLHAAEMLASDLGRHVTAAELSVLAYENVYDSDFADARKYFELAVQKKETLSNSMRANITRGLAETYFYQDPKFKDLIKGRQYFREAANVAGSQDDYHSRYNKFFVLKSWAYCEGLAGNAQDVRHALEEATTIWESVPPAMSQFWIPDLRNVANSWSGLGGLILASKPASEKARKQG